MTDIEKIELAARRAAERIRRFANNEAEYASANAMENFADQLANDELDRKHANQLEA